MTQRDIFQINAVGNDFEVIGQAENYHMRMDGPRRVAFCTHKHDAECIAEALNHMESIGWEQSNKDL